MSFPTMLGAHTPSGTAFICFPHTNGSPSFLATCHQSDVGPLSRQVTFKPVSAPLQHGIRSSDILLPHHHRQNLAACCLPKESYTGFSTFHLQKFIGLGACYRPGGIWVHESVICRRGSHLHYFWFKRKSHFRLFGMTTFIADSNVFTIRLPSTSPAYGCQKGTPLAMIPAPCGTSLRC